MTTKNPGLVLVTTYFVLFVVNSLIFTLANSIFPNQVVLGTEFINFPWAILHSAGVLSLIGTFAIPFFHEKERVLGRNLTSKEWMVGYLVLNFMSIWIIARFADQLGLGISSWMVALVLAAVLDVVQGIAMMKLEKVRSAH
jgi:uncharacterized membrane protein YvlD (DUF360 family)